MHTRKNVVVRFAPSPTGHLHIGGVRTALFNWAFARHHNGTFIIRIDDTDQTRSSENAMLGILQDFQWLGIDWDEGPSLDSDSPMENQIGDKGPYFQSQRLDIYNKYINQLIDKKMAYECYLTIDEINALKKEHSIDGIPVKYNREWALSITEIEKKRFIAEGRSPAIRLIMPTHALSFHDSACGQVSCSPDEFEDFIIRRSDGYPTYHLATVVDDYLMGITHILRGQEHRTNTFKHLALQERLNFPVPQYCHFPLIFNANGSKMSKRDKAKTARSAAKEFIAIEGNYDVLLKNLEIDKSEFDQFLKKKSDDVSLAAKMAKFLNIALPEIDVHDYRKSGYRPEPLLNYLSLLGWNPGNDVEKFDVDFIIGRFDLSNVGTSNSKFDRKKLLSFNADYLHNLSDEKFQQLFKEYCELYSPHFLDVLSDKLDIFCMLYKMRSNTLYDPLQLGRFFAVDMNAISFNEKAVKKELLKNERSGICTLRLICEKLEAISNWDIASITELLDTFQEENQLNMKKVAQPIRLAISGDVVTPPIIETLYLLGKDKTIQRIKRCIEKYG